MSRERTRGTNTTSSQRAWELSGLRCGCWFCCRHWLVSHDILMLSTLSTRRNTNILQVESSAHPATSQPGPAAASSSVGSPPVTSHAASQAATPAVALPPASLSVPSKLNTLAFQLWALYQSFSWEEGSPLHRMLANIAEIPVISFRLTGFVEKRCWYSNKHRRHWRGCLRGGNSGVPDSWFGLDRRGNSSSGYSFTHNNCVLRSRAQRDPGTWGPMITRELSNYLWISINYIHFIIALHGPSEGSKLSVQRVMASTVAGKKP